MRHAELRPNLASTHFPSQVQQRPAHIAPIFARPAPNSSRRRSSNCTGFRTALEAYTEGEDYDGGVDDTDLVAAGKNKRSFMLSSDSLSSNLADQSGFSTIEEVESKVRGDAIASTSHLGGVDENPEQQRLDNGKWACKHKCKDKAV